MIAWARTEKLPVSIRLVKGAYWDYETVLAKQNGWEIPVHTVKAETDAAYERIARFILENSDICHYACASHNIRTISAILEMARELKVPEDRYEFQVLYGMAKPVRKGLRNVAKRVRLYCPYGDLIPGMAYLVRRLLENTATSPSCARASPARPTWSGCSKTGQDRGARTRGPGRQVRPGPSPASRASRRDSGLGNYMSVDFSIPRSARASARPWKPCARASAPPIPCSSTAAT
jgi:RHH-type proline utilization regulon transcriptional repressor/proline dehydrogenase/delta 1-pyrroline-5-carboxylate dehydrogenase